MRFYLYLSILSILISGCIPKYIDKEPPKLKKTEIKTIKEETIKPIMVEIEQQTSTSYKVTMKTKKFAFSDTGFLVKKQDLLNLQILAIGKPILDLKIKQSDNICVGSLCNTKHGFNQSYLVEKYPDDLIKNILSFKPIFKGQNLTKTKSGFIQNIKTEAYSIKYQVNPKSIYFKDKQNKIIIKLRELKE